MDAMQAYYNGTKRGAHMVRAEVYDAFKAGTDTAQLCQQYGLRVDEVNSCIASSQSMENHILKRLRQGHRVSVIEDDYKHLGYHFAVITDIWKRNATDLEQKTTLLKI